MAPRHCRVPFRKPGLLTAAVPMITYESHRPESARSCRGRGAAAQLNRDGRRPSRRIAFTAVSLTALRRKRVQVDQGAAAARPRRASSGHRCGVIHRSGWRLHVALLQAHALAVLRSMAVSTAWRRIGFQARKFAYSAKPGGDLLGVELGGKNGIPRDGAGKALTVVGTACNVAGQTVEHSSCARSRTSSGRNTGHIGCACCWNTRSSPSRTFIGCRSAAGA